MTKKVLTNKQIKKKYYDAAKKLFDSIPEVKGETRTVSYCRQCDHLYGRRFIPYGIGIGATYDPCHCITTHNSDLGGMVQLVHEDDFRVSDEDDEDTEIEMCVECGDDPAAYPDPRSPPIEEGDCLCKGCRQWTLESVIDEYEHEISACKDELAELDNPGSTKKKKPKKKLKRKVNA